MTSSEEQLLILIKELEIEQHNARLKMASAKRQAMEAETILIEHTLHKENIIEQLRVMRVKAVDRSLSHEDKDLERFKLAHLELLKKI